MTAIMAAIATTMMAMMMPITPSPMVPMGKGGME